MTDSDDLLTEIGSGLDLEPPLEFAVGVQARIRRARRRAVLAQSALAVAASVGLVSVLVWRPSTPTVEREALLPERAPVAAPAMVEPAPVMADHEATARAPRSRTRAVRAAASTETRLEVITNQGEVLRALWADYRSQPGAVIVTGTDTDPGVLTPPIKVEPIVVPSIIVKEIGAEPARPATNSAPTNIRRDHATKETK